MIFEDRIRKEPCKRKITFADGRIENVKIEEMEGNVAKKGTPLNAVNLNKLLQLEKGTWIPKLQTIERKAPNYSTTLVDATYRKIGDMVYISFYIRGKITALNGTYNYAIITGLPYAPKKFYIGQHAIATGSIYNAVEENVENLNLIITQEEEIRIQHANGTSATKWKLSNDRDFEISGAGWYLAD